MSFRRRLALCVPLIALCIPAHADDAPRFGLIQLGAKLFASGAPASAPETAAPTPAPVPAAIPTSTAVAALSPASTIPRPRIRPALPETLAAATPRPIPGPTQLTLPAPATAVVVPVPASSAVVATATASAMGTRIDPTVTGAIDAAHEGPSVANAALAARALDPSVTPAPAVAPPAPISDGLLGDPTAAFPTTVAQPQAPSPQTIPFARPAAPEGPAEAVPQMVGNEPYQLVRELQGLQDQTAKGSVDALGAQRAVIASIDRAFAAVAPSAWQDPRNAVAAVAFVLSGGPPSILRALVEADPKPAVDERLLKGVLAYAEGRESEAYGFLTPLDATTLAPSIAAQIAMAQSALAVRTDPQQAMRLLALSRLLAPGTLVEEAAIRRQIFVADQLRDYAQVQSLARQYLDRFRRSVYAGNFRERFAAALSHMDFINDPAQFPRLDDMLASVEPEARAELYLTIALASVVNGRLNAARLAATRALPLTAAGSAGQSRARLYRAAVTVASAPTFDTAVEDYKAIDRSRLVAADLQLADAVGVAIAAVRSGTEVSMATPAPAGEPVQPSAVMTRASDAMKRADATLKVAAK